MADAYGDDARQLKPLLAQIETPVVRCFGDGAVMTGLVPDFRSQPGPKYGSAPLRDLQYDHSLIVLLLVAPSVVGDLRKNKINKLAGTQVLLAPLQDCI